MALAARAAARAALGARAFASAAAALPDLPYDYGALAPVIAPEIMQLHHGKHHAAYVANLNAALEKEAAASARGDVAALIALQPAVKFNGGGHINHSMFWQMLCPPGEFAPPAGALAAAIAADFGSLEALQGKLSAAAAGVQGSGWGWLGYSKDLGKLAVATTANQDPLETATGLVPIFGVDVWEHAYYLQYKNARPDYLKAIWQVANWRDAAARFEGAAKG